MIWGEGKPHIEGVANRVPLALRDVEKTPMGGAHRTFDSAGVKVFTTGSWSLAGLTRHPDLGFRVSFLGRCTVQVLRAARVQNEFAPEKFLN